MRKTTLLATLVALNLGLFAGIVMIAYQPTPAYAQAAALSGNYMMVTGEIQNEYDAIYMIDLRERILHSFIYERGRRRLMYTDSRDLERDFRNN